MHNCFHTRHPLACSTDLFDVCRAPHLLCLPPTYNPQIGTLTFELQPPDHPSQEDRARHKPRFGLLSKRRHILSPQHLTITITHRHNTSRGESDALLHHHGKRQGRIADRGVCEGADFKRGEYRPQVVFFRVRHVQPRNFLDGAKRRLVAVSHRLLQVALLRCSCSCLQVPPRDMCTTLSLTAAATGRSYSDNHSSGSYSSRCCSRVFLFDMSSVAPQQSRALIYPT